MRDVESCQRGQKGPKKRKNIQQQVFAGGHVHMFPYFPPVVRFQICLFLLGYLATTGWSHTAIVLEHNLYLSHIVNRIIIRFPIFHVSIIVTMTECLDIRATKHDYHFSTVCRRRSRNERPLCAFRPKTTAKLRRWRLFLTRHSCGLESSGGNIET